MQTINFQKLDYSVKINIDNNYIIFPHNYLKALYDIDNETIKICTIGENKIILSFNKDKVTDIYYKDKNINVVDYINKQL